MIRRLFLFTFVVAVGVVAHAPLNTTTATTPNRH